MVRIAKDLAVVLSLCFLLLHFTPALTKKHKIPHHKGKNVQEKAVSKAGIANKIFGTVLKHGWSLLGSKTLISALNFGTDLSATIAGIVGNSDGIQNAIKTCPQADEIQEKFDESKRISSEVETLKKAIDEDKLEAEIIEIYVNASFYQYLKTRELLEDVAEVQEQILNKTTGFEETGAEPLGATKAKIQLPNGLSQKLMNIRLTDYTFKVNMQGIGNTVKPKLTSATGKFQKVGSRLAPWAKIFMASFGIWKTIHQNFQKEQICTANLQKIESALEEIKVSLKNVTEMAEIAEESRQEMESAFADIHNQTVEASFLEALGKLKDLISDPLIANRLDDTVQDIKENIETYIASKDLPTESEEDKTKLAKLQRELNTALYQLSNILKCHRTRTSFLNKIESSCAVGNGTFTEIYNDNINGITDYTETCQDRVGPLPSLDEIKILWEQYVSANNAINKACLMNNHDLVELVKEKLRELKTSELTGTIDVNKIADSMARSNQADEIGEIIETVRSDPSIQNLPMRLQEAICRAKNMTDPALTKPIKLQIANTAIPDGRQATEEEFDNQQCPVIKEEEP